MTTLRETLRGLVLPVFTPTAVYATGAAAIVPAQVITGLALGLDAAQVALVAAWLGMVAVIGALVAGWLVHALGERRALGIAAGTAAVALVGLVVWLQSGNPGAVVAFLVTLTLTELADGVWGVARQHVMADRAPLEFRARVMNLYGGLQRAGRTIGPVIAAALIAAGLTPWVYVVHAVTSLAAFALVHRYLMPSAPDSHRPYDDAGDARWPWAALVTVGSGVLVLEMLRTSRDLLVPLWGLQGVHAAEAVVALVMGLSAAVELVLFYPAGIVMDRVGRLPVVVSCLVLMGTGFVAMAMIPGVGGYVAGAALIGLGNGIGAGIVKTLGADLAPRAILAKFLGVWNAIANSGSVVAPVATAAVVGVASLSVAVLGTGVVGVAGAVWMAVWLGRFHPRAWVGRR